MREGKAGFHKDQGIQGFRQTKTKYKKDKVNEPAKLLINTCPQCNSKRLWKDGLRYPRSNGKPIQRHICRECGYRFSETTQNNCSDDFRPSERDQNFHTLILKTLNNLSCNCQVGVSEAEGTKNLAEEATRIEKRAAGATEPDKATLKGKIVELGWCMKKEGYSSLTIKKYTDYLMILVNRGANLLDPESVKEVLAQQDSWKESTKTIVVAAYNIFAVHNKIKWDPPKYKFQRKLPFIPLESEIDALIANSGKKMAAMLQLLKETGMRIGEAKRLRWIDVDLENNTITVNEPEKRSNPRMIKVSKKLVAMLNCLPRKNERVFPATYHTLERNFHYLRERTAIKLQNPRLRHITFHTLRHWKATMEYHKTKDIIHVMQMLGHKNIQNTMLYTQLITFENDEFHVRVAETLEEDKELIEAGFEYVTERDGLKIYRKRK